MVNFSCKLHEKNFLGWYDHFIKMKNMQQFFYVHKLRDVLNAHNFSNILLEFLSLNEGCRLYPYLDSRNHWNIGYGLLLKKRDSNKYTDLAIEAFKNVLNRDIYAFIPIDKLSKINMYNFMITKDEAKKLLQHILKINELKLIKLMPYYKTLEFSHQIAIHSLYYNALLSPNAMDSFKEILNISNLFKFRFKLWQIL